MILSPDRSNKKGFTVLELMITVLITSVFMVSFYAVFHGMNSEMWRSKKYFDNNTTAKNVMDRIAKDVKEAIAIIPAYGGINTGDSTLILKLPSIDNGGEPTNIGTQFDYVTYRLNPSNSAQLLRSLDVLDGISVREGAADHSDSVIGSGLSSVRFSHDGTGLTSCDAGVISSMKYLSINITTQTTTLSTTQTSQISSDVNLMTGSLS